jgi:hypothetical protein
VCLLYLLIFKNRRPGGDLGAKVPKKVDMDITNEGKRERREEMVQHSIIACPFEEKYAHTMKNTKNRNSNTKLQEKEKELKY